MAVDLLETLHQSGAEVGAPSREEAVDGPPGPVPVLQRFGGDEDPNVVVVGDHGKAVAVPEAVDGLPGGPLDVVHLARLGHGSRLVDDESHVEGGPALHHVAAVGGGDLDLQVPLSGLGDMDVGVVEIGPYPDLRGLAGAGAAAEEHRNGQDGGNECGADPSLLHVFFLPFVVDGIIWSQDNGERTMFPKDL